MSEDRIRLIVADDHKLFRDGLVSLLGSTGDIKVVGEASTGREAVEKASKIKPDLILMDIRMQGMNGIDAARELTEACPGTRCIMLTMVERDESILAALQAGADGYILKGADKEEVLRIIRAAARGETLFGKDVGPRVKTFFRRAKGSIAPNLQSTAIGGLTDREQELLDLMARGMNNSQIARQLHISPKTVSNHVSNIYGKLQVSDRVEAVLLAREAGLGADPAWD